MINLRIKNILKKLLWIFLLVIFLLGLNHVIESNRDKYLVEVHFCDNREPIILEVRSMGRPNSSDINTYKEAVPRYKGHLNVCQVKTIMKL